MKARLNKRPHRGKAYLSGYIWTETSFANGFLTLHFTPQRLKDWELQGMLQYLQGHLQNTVVKDVSLCDNVFTLVTNVTEDDYNADPHGHAGLFKEVRESIGRSMKKVCPAKLVLQTRREHKDKYALQRSNTDTVIDGANLGIA